jgi:hypothetical protein
MLHFWGILVGRRNEYGDRPYRITYCYSQKKLHITHTFPANFPCVNTFPRQKSFIRNYGKWEIRVRGGLRHLCSPVKLLLSSTNITSMHVSCS